MAADARVSAEAPDLDAWTQPANPPHEVDALTLDLRATRYLSSKSCLDKFKFAMS